MLRSFFYISTLLLFFVFSCSKKNEVGMQAAYSGTPVVNFNNYMDDNGNFGYHKVDLQLKDTFVSANIEIKLSNTTATASSDIFIYLTKVDALVSEYNMVNGTGLEPVSSASIALDYDFTKPVILKKGQRLVTIPLKVNGLKLALGKINAIGIAIASVQGAELNAGEESKLVVEFGTKNEWDGNYVANGYVYHPALPRAIVNRPKVGATAGSNAITMELGDLGTSGYIALFTISGTNVTITAAPGSAGGPYTMFTAGLPTTNPGYTPAWAGASACNNTYNAATKTFYVRYGYMGATGWRVTEEKITKQ